MANNAQAKVVTPKVPAPKVPLSPYPGLTNPILSNTSKTSTQMGAPYPGLTNPLQASGATPAPIAPIQAAQNSAPGTMASKPKVATDPYHSTDQGIMATIAQMQAAAVNKPSTDPLETVVPPTAPAAPTGATGASDPNAQYNALLATYKSSLEAPYSADYTAAETGQRNIEAQQAALNQAYTKQNQGIKGRGIEAGLEQGQLGRLGSQYAEQQGALSAQLTPLKDQLAQEQAKRQAAMDIAGKEFEVGAAPISADALKQAKIAETEAAAKVIPAGGTYYDAASGMTIQGQPNTAQAPKYVPATKYQSAGYYDPATNTFTPVPGGNVPAATGTGGNSASGGNPAPTSAQGKLITADQNKAISRIDSGESNWGQEWDMMKAKYPNLSNDYIDTLLGGSASDTSNPTGRATPGFFQGLQNSGTRSKTTQTPEQAAASAAAFAAALQAAQKAKK